MAYHQNIKNQYRAAQIAPHRLTKITVLGQQLAKARPRRARCAKAARWRFKKAQKRKKRQGRNVNPKGGPHVIPQATTLKAESPFSSRGTGPTTVRNRFRLAIHLTTEKNLVTAILHHH